MKFGYQDTRPRLTIEEIETKKIGHNWEAITVRVTSRQRLSLIKLTALYSNGFIAAGQDFSVTSRCDGFETEVGIDMLEGLHPSFRTPLPPRPAPYYAYDCVVKVDFGG